MSPHENILDELRRENAELRARLEAAQSMPPPESPDSTDTVLPEIILNSAPSLIFATDRHHRYIAANQAFARYLGRNPEELIGKTHRDFFPPALAERFEKVNETIMASGECQHIEETVIGTRMFSIKFPLRDSGGNVSGIGGLVTDISDRKRAEETNRLQAQMLAHMHDGVALIRVDDGSIAYCNPRFHQMLGYSREELLGKHISTINATHSKSPEEVASDIMSELHLHGWWSGEVLNRRKDGSFLWCQASVSHFEHSVLGRVWISVQMDISARKEAEAASARLEQSAEFLRQSIVLISGSTDPDAAFVQLLHRGIGLSEMEIGAVYLFEGQVAVLRHQVGLDPTFIPLVERRPFDTPYVAAIIQRPTEIIDLATAFPEHHKISEGFGLRQVWCIPLKADDQAFGFLIVASRSNAAANPVALNRVRILALETGATIARLQTERRHRAILATMANGIVVQSRDGAIIDCNAAAEAILGLTRDQLLGRTSLDPRWGTFYEDGRPCLGEDHPSMVSLRTSQPCADVVLSIAIPDGTRKWISVNARPMFQPGQSQPYAAVSSFADITARKHLEDRLRQAQRVESLGRLAGGMAHEFNNLLAGIMLNLELAKSECSDLGSTTSLEEIMGLSKRAARLIRQLLAFSRQSTLEIQPFDLASNIAEECNMISRLVGERVVLQFAPPSDLPLVMADALSIKQVLLNLCLNARDAMPNGGRLLIDLAAVEVDARRSDSWEGATPGPFVCLSVTDTGMGMEEHVLKRLFEPFFTTKGVGRGTGLGLATVRGIISQHRGGVEVDTRPGHGSTFRVFLPVANNLAPDPSSRPSPALQCRAPADLKATILLVEDESSLRRVTRAFLTRAGFVVLEATSADEAWALWQKHQSEIDLIYTDLVMPGEMSGRQLAELTVAIRPNLRVIITSGYSSELVDQGASPNPSFVHLPKPCPPDKVVGTILDCLRARPS
ncbi:MAG: PAS domain S-box protein [Verrucomicrobiales bacterium]|nr:PAS domain S-box protein [Verrucomicrobiales bacterium]